MSEIKHPSPEGLAEFRKEYLHSHQSTLEAYFQWCQVLEVSKQTDILGACLKVLASKC